MTSIEKIIQEIDKELNLLSNLFGTEIMGRKIGLHFAKRICEETKEMHKQEIIDAHLLGLIRSLDMEATKQANEYYQETFVSKGSDEMDSNYSQHVTKNHTFKTAFEILQSNLTIADTSEFREIHIPEIIASMEQYKAQLPKQETLYTEEQVKLAITLAKDSDYNSTKEIIQSLK